MIPGQCSAPQRRCQSDRECGTNEKCVQPGECICPPPFFLDTSDGGKCKNPCERYACGINAKCTPSDPPQCMCEAGFKGDPLQGCFDENGESIEIPNEWFIGFLVALLLIFLHFQNVQLMETHAHMVPSASIKNSDTNVFVQTECLVTHTKKVA